MRRGDVCWATLAPRSGSEQQGRRPVIVISRDTFNTNKNWKSIIIVPVSTSANQRQRGPTAVPIAKGVGGLPEDSVAVCHHVTTLDRDKLGAPIGTLPPPVLAQVELGLKAAMNLL